MVAVDTSTLVAFIRGDRGYDVDAFEAALEANQVSLPPPVLCELLSYPALSNEIVEWLKNLPALTARENFWERAGIIRSGILKMKKRAKLADTLIAQFCIDNRMALITRDRDFLAFAEAGSLQIVTNPAR